MAKKNQRNQPSKADDRLRTELPPGVKLLRILEGHQDAIVRLAFDPQGETLASGSVDETVKLWEGRTGKLLRILEDTAIHISDLAFDPQGETLASGGNNETVNLWNTRSGKLMRRLKHNVLSLVF